jgi:dTDP-4-amino-4,6-dideoxygalactose transaminase
VGRPNIGNRQRFLERVNDLLDRRILSNDGPYAEAFEREILRLTGVQYCVATCNGTLALQLLAKAAGLTGEVILPSFTFVATAHALEWIGLKPVFCDVDPKTHNLDPARVEELITSRTSAIVGVHLWGRPCCAQDLELIAARHNLALFFDAAHALGCSHQGRLVGNLGDAEILSFHATKICNSFEGGAVVTNDSAIADKVRLMKRFGFSAYDTVTSSGTNAKLSEVGAAMGLTSLESFSEFVTHNRTNYEAFRVGLSETPGISLIQYDHHEQNNYQYVIIEVDEVNAGLTRDDIHRILWMENILARRYFFPGCHRMTPYLRRGGREESLPVTERLAATVLALPTGTDVDPATANGICNVIRLACQFAPQVRDRLSLGVLLTSS